MSHEIFLSRYFRRISIDSLHWY